jgi:Sugar-binding N-terminal domain
MPLVLGCIADDYTGASDLANTLTRNGLRTIQTIGIPGTGLAMPEIDAVVKSARFRQAKPSPPPVLQTAGCRSAVRVMSFIRFAQPSIQPMQATLGLSAKRSGMTLGRALCS